MFFINVDRSSNNPRFEAQAHKTQPQQFALAVLHQSQRSLFFIDLEANRASDPCEPNLSSEFRTQRQTEFLIEAFRLQQRAAETGQKLTALQTETGKSFFGDELEGQAKLATRRSLDSIKNNFKEIQRNLEIWLARIIGDVEGILARDGASRVSGAVTYNGHGMNEFVPQRTSTYISQHDLHIGELTAVSLEGQRASVVTDYVLKILGLEVSADTMVGDKMVRGPRENILQFFEYMGFKCPERKGVADFLREVTSKKDQEQYWARRDKPYNFVTVNEFAEAFLSFHIGRKLGDELAIPFEKAKRSMVLVRRNC
ncbi:Pleiotropic drug resistance protein 1 [Camellia lanceoleosa]|uniref:Pleiotropic drug resistance protein 1 n=1 Tax=Camellia lanceoleosa TaxID=1840588 RepID=A0ACC0FFE8_9ERIC|nr:Pleiotropic drug resistance protein 1 [Camellia lanceoleosa]